MQKLYLLCLLLAGTAAAGAFPAQASNYFSFSIGGPGYRFSYGYSGGYFRPHYYHGYKRYYRHPYHHGYKRYHQHPYHRHGMHRRYPGFWKPYDLRKHYHQPGYGKPYGGHFSFGGHQWFRHGARNRHRGLFGYHRY